MRKVIVLQFMTLDVVVQAPGGQGEDDSGGFPFGGWVAPFFDEAAGEEMGRQMTAPFDLLLGRKTYDIFAAYWPHHMEGNPGPEFAAATKYVATRGNPQDRWERTVFLRGDAAAAVRELKEGDGPPLQVHGSADFIQTLLRHGLADELWLKVFPVTLGQGKKLFAGGAVPQAFRLTECSATPAGVILARFEKAGEVRLGDIG